MKSQRRRKSKKEEERQSLTKTSRFGKQLTNKMDDPVRYTMKD